MKKNNLLYVILAGLMVFTSCKDKVEDPTPGFEYYLTSDLAYKAENPNPEVVYVGQEVSFVSTANDADVYTVWTGDLGHNYELRDIPEGTPNDDNYVKLKNKGVGLEYKDGVAQSKYGYKYVAVGEYKIAFVSRNILDGGLEYAETVEYKTITVADTVADLFPAPGIDASSYKFYVSSPKSIKNTDPVVDGLVATLNVPFEADLSEVKISLAAGWAEIKTVDGFGVVTVDESTGKISWLGSLEGKDGKVEVSSLGGTVSNVYTIKAQRNAKVSDKDLTSFSVSGFDAEISGTTVSLVVPSAFDLTTATPEFTSSDLSTVEVSSTVQTSGTTVQDLSAGATYTVVAQDETTQDYTVSISTVDTEITAFSFDGLIPARTGTITGTDIALTVITGTDLTTLVPTIDMTQFASAVYGVDNTPLVSGVTEVDFTSPVTITLSTDAGDTVVYTVTVTEI